MTNIPLDPTETLENLEEEKTFKLRDLTPILESGNISEADADTIREIVQVQSIDSFASIEGFSNSELSEAQVFQNLRLVGDAIGREPLDTATIEHLDNSLDSATVSSSEYYANRTILIDEVINDRGRPFSHNDSVDASLVDEVPIQDQEIAHITSYPIPLGDYVKAINNRGEGAIVNLSQENINDSFPLGKINEMFGLPLDATEEELVKHVEGLDTLPESIPPLVLDEINEKIEIVEQHPDNHIYIAHTNDPDRVNIINLLLRSHPQITIVAGSNENNKPLHFNQDASGIPEYLPEEWYSGVVLYTPRQEDVQTLSETFSGAIISEEVNENSVINNEITAESYATPQEVELYITYAKELGMKELSLDILDRDAETLKTFLTNEGNIQRLLNAQFIEEGETAETISSNPNRIAELFSSAEDYFNSLESKYPEGSSEYEIITNFSNKIVTTEQAMEISQRYYEMVIPDYQASRYFDSENTNRDYSFERPDKGADIYVSYEDSSGTPRLAKLLQGNSFSSPRAAANRYSQTSN